MSAGRFQEPVTVAVVSLAFALCALAPLAVLAVDAASAPDLGALDSAALWLLFARTAASAGVVTLLTLAIGVPLGLALARSDAAGRTLALVLHAFPLFLPPFLLALGWFHVFGQNGVAGSLATSRALFSSAGAVAVMASVLTPVVTLMTVLGLDGIDPNLEEAARIAAPPRRVAARILLPLAWPSTAVGGLVVFALAFGELGVPVFLRVPAYPAAVFARLGGLDYAPGEAFTMTVPLLGVALLLLFLERVIRRGRSHASLGLRTGRRAMPLGRWRWPASTAVWLAVLVPLVPILALAARAQPAAALPWFGAATRTSVIAAVSAATLVTTAGLIIGHQRARGQRVGRVLETAGFLLFVTPAAVLGAGLIDLWNRPWVPPLYGTGAMVVLGLAARHAVLGIRPLAIALARSSPTLEDAARVAGARYGRRFLRIVLPLHGRAVAATWVLVLIFALRDLDVAALVYPPGGQTLTVQIFTLEANGPPGVVAALAMAQVAMTAVAVSLGLLLIRRFAR